MSWRRLTVGAVLAIGLVVSAAVAAPGRIDPTFGDGGKVTTDIGGGNDRAFGVAFHPSRETVVVGESAGDRRAFAVARYRPNGSLDPDFSGDGKETTSFGGGGGARDIAVQVNDEKPVVVGEVSARFGVARYNADGSLDGTFSGDGVQTIGEAGGVATAVALQRDAKIVAVGVAGSGSPWTVARYNADGSPDTTFAGDGIQTTSPFGSAQPTDVAVQNDGKVVVVGEGFSISRYDADGSLDRSFSGDGRVRLAGFARTAAGVVSRGRLGGTRITVVGTASGSRGLAVARFEADGSLDRRFSGDGRQRVGFGGARAIGVDLAIGFDGKTAAVGNVAGRRGSAVAVARLNRNGTLDRSFSRNGRLTAFRRRARAQAVALQDNGRILVAGHTLGGNEDFLLARFR